MAVNAYSKGPVAPAFTSNYISQYVPLPTEGIEAAMRAKQEDYNHWKDGQATLSTGLMGIQAATPSDAAYLKQAQGSYQKQLDAFADQDLTRPEVQRGLKDVATQISGDRTLQGIQTTHARIGELQAQAKKLSGEGKFHQAQSVLNSHALDQYEQGGGAAKGNTYGGMDFSPELNAVGKADEYFKALHPEEADALGMIAGGQDGAIAYKSTHGGVSFQRALETAKSASHDWLSSGEGRQVMLDGQAQGMSPEQAQQYSLQFLVGRGKTASYSTSSNNMDVAYREGRSERHSDRKAKEKDAKEAGGGDTQDYLAPEAKTTFNTNPQFDDKGNLVGTGVYDGKGAVKSLLHGDFSGAYNSAFNNQMSAGEVEKGKTIIDGTAHANQVIEEHNAKVKDPKQKLPKLTQHEWATNYAPGIMKNEEAHVDLWTSGKQVEDATKAIFAHDGGGSFSTLKVRISGTDQSPIPMSGSEFYKVTHGGNDLTPDNVKDKGGVTVDGPAKATSQGWEQPITSNGIRGYIQWQTGEQLGTPRLPVTQQDVEHNARSQQYHQKVTEAIGHHPFTAWNPDTRKLQNYLGYHSPTEGKISYKDVH